MYHSWCRVRGSTGSDERAVSSPWFTEERAETAGAAYQDESLSLGQVHQWHHRRQGSLCTSYTQRYFWLEFSAQYFKHPEDTFNVQGEKVSVRFSFVLLTDRRRLRMDAFEAANKESVHPFPRSPASANADEQNKQIQNGGTETDCRARAMNLTVWNKKNE